MIFSVWGSRYFYNTLGVVELWTMKQGWVVSCLILAFGPRLELYVVEALAEEWSWREWLVMASLTGLLGRASSYPPALLLWSLSAGSWTAAHSCWVPLLPFFPHRLFCCHLFANLPNTPWTIFFPFKHVWPECSAFCWADLDFQFSVSAARHVWRTGITKDRLSLTTLIWPDKLRNAL